MPIIRRKKTPNEVFDKEIETIVKHCIKAQKFMKEFLDNPSQYTQNFDLALTDTITIGEDIRRRLKKANSPPEEVVVKTTTKLPNKEDV